MSTHPPTASKPAADERPALKEYWITNYDNRFVRHVFETLEAARAHNWTDEYLIHVREVKNEIKSK